MTKSEFINLCNRIWEQDPDLVEFMKKYDELDILAKAVFWNCLSLLSPNTKAPQTSLDGITRNFLDEKIGGQQIKKNPTPKNNRPNNILPFHRENKENKPK